MTLRNYVLLAITQYVAIVAGVLIATGGREKPLAVVIPLALVVPTWMILRRKYVPPSDQTESKRTAMKPERMVILYIALFASQVWNAIYRYQHANWFGFVISFVASVFALYLLVYSANRMLSANQVAP